MPSRQSQIALSILSPAASTSQAHSPVGFTSRKTYESPTKAKSTPPKTKPRFRTTLTHLRSISRGKVIYATHSPLFVGLDRFNQIRLLRKTANGADKPKITNVVGTTLDKVAEKIWAADGGIGTKHTGAELGHRLHAIMTPWINEGFFANVVVLVEGEDDCAAILGMARVLNKDLEGNGISVIPMSGKRSLDRPAVIFMEFGIPVYILWDSDGNRGATAGVCQTCGKPLDGRPDPADNHRLLRIVQATPEDWPARQEAHYCCFKTDLESTLKAEIGDALFEKLLSDCQTEFGIPKRKHAVKNPTVISTIIERAQKNGKTSKALENVVLSICKLADNQPKIIETTF